MHEAAQRLHEACGGRIVNAEAIHLTLVFLGNVDPRRLDALKTMAGGVGARRFQFMLESLGYWRNNRIAWVAPRQTPEQLTGLVHFLEEGLAATGFHFDKRPYVPHITLLRKANCRNPVELPEPISWQVEEFVLVESELSGSIYNIIGRWTLS